MAKIFSKIFNYFYSDSGSQYVLHCSKLPSELSYPSKMGLLLCLTFTFKVMEWLHGIYL